MSKRVLRVENNILSLTDTIKLNSIAKNEDIIVEIENTKGQNPQIFKKFANNITISVLGGLNYVDKDKYNSPEYRESTFYKPKEVVGIIQTLESIERQVDPSWNQLEKAMYVYKVFVENLNYNHNANDSIYEDRNLLVLKNRKGVCAGFSILYKEAMDRLGIPCEYQNMQHHHSWNVLKIDDKYIPVDITYDICDKLSHRDNKCHFKYFGTNQDFYNDRHHNIFNEKDETVFQITTIPEDVLREAYQHIIKIKSYKTPIKDEICNNQQVKYAMHQFDKFNICLYQMDNQLYLNKYQEGMSKEEVFIPNNIQSNVDDITLPKFKIYNRDDNTSFCIIKDEESEGTYYYCDLSSEENSYRSYKVFSENNLIQPRTIIEEKTIANKLLSQDRLIRKVDHFNGYIGFAKNNMILADEQFERDTLNIVNRK